MARPAAAAALALLAAALVAAACGSGAAGTGAAAGTTVPTVRAPRPTSSIVPAFYHPPSPLPPGRHGALIRAERVEGVAGVPGGVRLWRILYRSETALGRPVAASGYVVAPGPPAPPGGYPVVAWDHGTTGMAPPCAPSLFTNLDGQQLYLAPYLDRLLAAGDAVVATDYQGEGTPGLHPYLVGSAEARDTLDSVLAAATLPGLHLSRTVVVLGHSQGGQAALFTGQDAASYAPSLHVAGVVAIAPATNMSAAVAAAGSLSGNGGISHGQGDLDFVAMALWAWSHTYPDLSPPAVFTLQGRQLMAVAGTGCLPQIARALRGVTPDQVLQPGVTGSAAVQADARLNDPGSVPTPAPILVVQGTGDQTVPYALTQFFVKDQACKVGDRVTLTLYPGDTHSGVIAPAANEILSWIAARFAGRPATSACTGQSG